MQGDFSRTKLKSQRDGSGINVVERGWSSNPSSNTERTTRSSSTGVLINGNAGRPGIGNRYVARRGLQGVTDGVDPFRATDCDFFQMGAGQASFKHGAIKCCPPASACCDYRPGCIGPGSGRGDVIRGSQFLFNTSLASCGSRWGPMTC